MKNLKDLDLMDRFLFSEAMDDPENMQLVLEIILGHDMVMHFLPHTEKELRTSSL